MNEFAHLQLFALKDVAVCTARLARSATDASIQTTRGKLRLKKRVDFRVLSSRKRNSRRKTNRIDISVWSPIAYMTLHTRTFLPFVEVTLRVIRQFFLLLLACICSRLLLSSLLGHGLGVLHGRN